MSSVEEPTTEIRPLPLKIAGVIGVLTTAFYLAVALGGDQGVGPALFWVLLIGAAAMLAWFSDQLGRRAAMVAGGIFFVLGVLSPLAFALVFLAAAVLCVVGFVRFPPDSEEYPDDS